MTDAALAAILREARTVAVVGLSPKLYRPSHGVARYLQRAGYRIVPVNPGHAEILGEPSFASLRDAAAVTRLDVVNVFRRSDAAGAVVREAIPLRPALIFLQLGVVDPDAAAQAQAAGIPFIMDRCLAVEHQRLVT